jgi:hypothetical protein
MGGENSENSCKTLLKQRQADTKQAFSGFCQAKNAAAL